MKGSEYITIKNASGDSYSVLIPDGFTFNVNVKNKTIVTSSDGIEELSSDALERIDKNVNQFNKNFKKYFNLDSASASSDASQEAFVVSSYNASYNASMDSLYNQVSDINTNIYGLGIAFLVFIMFYVVFKEVRGWR